VLRSNHQPMAGRPLHAPKGFTTPAAAANAFRVKWRELVDAGEPFLCWVTAQKCNQKNAGQTLAKRHRKRKPADLVDVIDSTTPELAAELAADPNGFAERRTAQARAQGGNWAIYCSPAISSGLRFSWDAEKRKVLLMAHSLAQIDCGNSDQGRFRGVCGEDGRDLCATHS
jgi:hypothetical protein